MRKFSTALKILVSLTILLFIIQKADFDKDIPRLGDIRYTFLAASVVLIVVGQVMRAYRLALMVFGESAFRKLRETLRIQMISFLPGILSPAKIGEITKIYMLKAESGVPATRGLICFVAERVLDLMFLGPLAALGLYVFFRSDFRMDWNAGWTLAIALMAVSLAGAMAAGLLWANARGVSLPDFWRAVSPNRLFGAAVATACYWGVVFLEVWCFCKAVRLEAHVSHITLVVPPALLSSMLPISFSGFGIREAAMIILLQRPPVGASYEQSLMISLMYDILGLGIPALMGAAFWLTRKRNGFASD